MLRLNLRSFCSEGGFSRGLTTSYSDKTSKREFYLGNSHRDFTTKEHIVGGKMAISILVCSNISVCFGKCLVSDFTLSYKIEKFITPHYYEG